MKTRIGFMHTASQGLLNILGRAAGVLALGLVSVPSVSAAVSNEVTTFSFNQVITGNLLGGLLPTEYASDQTRIGGLDAIYDEAAANVSSLTDGTAEIADADMSDNMFAVMSGDILTYSLGGAYDLTEIQIYISWRDAGRDDFSNATVEYSMTSGESYITLIDGFSTDNFGEGGVLVLSKISDGGEVIAAGATHVRFTFTNVENGAIGASELVVFGTSAIPEPSAAAAIFGTLALGFVASRRRRA